MIINEERKVIYLHNPKCGGTFLRELYIEKYGKTEATKWWKPFSPEYGTDLGHITYDDLPRFIPEWKEYRVVVMIRNPYNRFYSGIKEMRRHVIPFCFYNVQYGKCLIYKEWHTLSKFRKSYEFLRSICPWTDANLLVKLNLASPEEACKQIFDLRRSKRDYILRNKKNPWLNPQSFFCGEEVEVLRYESVADWVKLLDLFGLSEYQERLSIAKDYAISDIICDMIDDLYPEDKNLIRAFKIDITKSKNKVTLS